MERKPNRAKSERDTVNIGLEYWDVVRSDVGSRHTVDDREFRFLAILEGIREVSHGMGDLISVGQSGLILGIRYADKIDDRCHRSWVYCPLCPSTVQAQAVRIKR